MCTLVVNCVRMGRVDVDVNVCMNVVVYLCMSVYPCVCACLGSVSGVSPGVAPGQAGRPLVLGPGGGAKASGKVAARAGAHAAGTQFTPQGKAWRMRVQGSESKVMWSSVDKAKHQQHDFFSIIKIFFFFLTDKVDFRRFV